MLALNRMAAGGKTEVLGALASSPAAVSAYVRELKGSREEQVATMSALKHLAALPIARQSIVDAGGLDGLVALATSPSMDQVRVRVRARVRARVRVRVRGRPNPNPAPDRGHDGAAALEALEPALAARVMRPAERGAGRLGEGQGSGWG